MKSFNWRTFIDYQNVKFRGDFKWKNLCINNLTRNQLVTKRRCSCALLNSHLSLWSTHFNEKTFDQTKNWHWYLYYIVYIQADFTLVDPLTRNGPGVKFSDVAGLKEPKIEVGPIGWNKRNIEVVQWCQNICVTLTVTHKTVFFLYSANGVSQL